MVVYFSFIITTVELATKRRSNASGDLDITESVNITGAGMATTIIDGNAGVLNERILNTIAGAVTVTLTDLTMQNANAGAWTGAGIYHQGTTLELTRVAIKNNTTAGHGGGISSVIANVINLTDVEISGNSATGTSNGGGMYVIGPTVTWNGGLATGNSANTGGAVRNSTTFDATNVTFSGNSAIGNGPAFTTSNGNTTLTNVTIYNNTGFPAYRRNGGTITIKNTIFANNPDGNCFGTITTAGGNLETLTDTCDFTDPTDQVNVSLANANVDATLSDNGGVTKTHALNSGSYAIDAAVNANCPATDQRGETRGFDGDGTPNSPQTGDCDIGAYENNAVTTTIADGTAQSSRDVWAGGRFFSVDAFTLQTNTGTDTLTGLTVTFTGNDVNDVSASGVMIWRDDGGTANQWDSTDTLIDTASFSGSTASFTGLSESINTSATQYIVTYNIDSAATSTNTLQGAVTAATVTNTLVNNDNVDATLTIEADSVHETSVYKIGYSPGAFEDVFIKGSSSPTTDLLTAMSLGSDYSTTPGSLITSWDPNATVTTVLNNSVVKQAQMVGSLIDSAGNIYGTNTVTVSFYEDRAVLDVDINITTNPGGTDYWFMNYGQWDDATLDETFWWSSNNSGSYNSANPAPNFNTGDQTAPISFQALFELGATDGLVSSFVQNITGYTPAQLKNSDPDTGLVDIAYQKVNPGTGNKHAVVVYGFDTTTGGYDTSIAEARQDDSIDPATLDFTLAGGDGALSGDGFVEERGAYTLTDGDADDHVKFEFQNTTTHYAPVFEISSWGAAAPSTILVNDVVKTSGVDYNAAVSGGTLYLQYLGNFSTNTKIEIGDELIAGTLYSDEGTTAVGAGIQVRLLVNGVTKGVDETSASGTFSFATPLSATNKLLVYVDEDDTDSATDGTTVTISDGNNLTGLDVYYQHLITREDNGGSLTNALMKSAVEPYVDSEIIYSVDGSNVLTVSANNELYVPATHTFAPGANTNADDVKVLGILTAGTTTLTLSGDWNSSNGTFNRDTSTLVLNGTGNTFTPKDNQNFHNITVGAGADINVVSSGGSDNFTVYEDLTLNGTLTVPSGYTMTQRFSVPGTTTLIGASGVLAGAGTFERIVYNPTLTFSNAVGITIDDFIYRLTFTNDNVVSIPAVTYGGNLTIRSHSASGVSESVTINSGTLTVGGNISVLATGSNNTTSVTLRNSDNDATLNVTGNLVIGDNADSGGVSFVTGDATVTVGGNVTINDDAESDSTMSIDASDGTPTISVGGNWDSSGGTFTYGSSTVDLTGTGNLKTSGTQYTAHFYNLNAAANTKITTLQSHVGVGNVLTLSTGTITGAFELGVFGNSGSPVVNPGATVSTSFFYYRPSNGTINVAGGTYDVTGMWFWPSASNATFNIAGDLTVNGNLIVDVDTGNSGVVVNTQNNVLNTIHMDFGEPGYDGSSTFNFGSSLVDINGRFRVGTNGGSHAINLGSATINISGNWLATNGTGVLTVDPGTSTVTLDGTTSNNLDPGASAFNNLKINKTDAADGNDNITLITNDLTVNSGLTILDGELIQQRSIATGAVTLADASSKWTNITDNANVTLAGDVANTGSISFDAPTGDLIQIRSSVGGTQRNWQGSGTFSMTDVDVQDQTAIGGTPANIVVTSGTNSGNNINWLFGTKSIGGTVYIDDDEATTLNSKAIKIVVYDGATQTSYTTSTNGSGVYSISNAELVDTNIVAVYLDDETEEGTTVFKSDGVNVANLNVYQNHVSIRSDSGAISNAEIATADDTDDDVKYNVSGNDITLGSSYELFVFNGSTYTPGGNVATQGATGDIDFRGTVNGGTNTFTVSGDWDSSNGDWNANTSTVDLTGTGTVKQYMVASPWSNGFYNLSLAAAGQVTTFTSSNLWVKYLTTGTGTLTDAANSYIVLLQGTGNVFIDGGATLTFSSLNYRVANNTQNVVGRDYTGIDTLEFDAVGGATGSGTYEMQGNVIANDVHLQINNSPGNTRNSILNTNNHDLTADNLYVGVNGSADDYTELNAGSSTVDINGDVVIYPTDGNGDNVLNASTSSWTVSGDWSNSDTFTASTSSITLDGIGQGISGSTTFNDLIKDVTSSDTLTFANGSTQIVSGTLTLAGRSGNILNLRSDSPSTQWNLNVSGSAALTYVDVDDSNATSGNTIYAYYSTDDTAPSNNDNWVFQSLQLVKQVWTEDGSTCLASIPADSNCNSSATSTVVPSSTNVTFLIFIRNVMPVAVTDLRFQDLIDDAEFTYQAGTMFRSANDGSAPSDTANLATIMSAASIAQTDAYDGDTQVDEFAGIDTAASPDDLQIGGAGGVGQNDTLLKFKAVKN